MHRRITGKLVIATHNPGKLAEMKELLAPYGIEVVSAGELGLPEPDETGDDLSRQCRDQGDRGGAGGASFPAFADDSGIVVDALDGAPGIYSRALGRPEQGFRGRDGADRAPAAGARRHHARQRNAHFVSALCVAWPDDHLEEVEARVDGTLVWPPRGTAGFGYDPMFLPDGHDRTFGEMTSIEKHGLPPLGLGLSHRARAFVKLAEICLEPR